MKHLLIFPATSCHLKHWYTGCPPPSGDPGSYSLGAVTPAPVQLPPEDNDTRGIDRTQTQVYIPQAQPCPQSKHWATYTMGCEQTVQRLPFPHTPNTDSLRLDQGRGLPPFTLQSLGLAGVHRARVALGAGAEEGEGRPTVSVGVSRGSAFTSGPLEPIHIESCWT